MSLAASHHLKKRQFEANLTQIKLWLFESIQMPSFSPTLFGTPTCLFIACAWAFI